MLCIHLSTHERVVLHLRCAPVSRQENTNTPRKNWVKRKLASFFFFSCIFKGTKSAHGDHKPREFSTVADYTDYAGCLKSAMGDAVLHYLLQMWYIQVNKQLSNCQFLGIFLLKYHENCRLGDRETLHFMYMGKKRELTGILLYFYSIVFFEFTSELWRLSSSRANATISAGTLQQIFKAKIKVYCCRLIELYCRNAAKYKWKSTNYTKSGWFGSGGIKG